MKISQLSIFNKVSFLDQLLFTKHLAIMIKSGIIISEALDTLISHAKSPYFKSVLKDILKNIQNGQSLAKSMKLHPGVFSEFYISLIEVGEESGTLEANLEFLAVQLAKDYAIRKKVKGAMLYPSLIFSTIVILGGFISYFILPQLVDFFDAFGTDLPLPTVILLFFANIMKVYGALIIGGGALLFIGAKILIRTPQVRPFWHRMLLSMPVMGQFIKAVNMSRLSRNLGTLLKSGVPLLRCLETTTNTLDNDAFKSALQSVKNDVRKGTQISRALEGYTYSFLGIHHELFPLLLVKMIAVGEKTGKLEEVLLYLSEFYEEDIDNFTKNLTTILEPFLLITIGIVVGFVAMAIISPIYQLTGSIK